MALILSGHPLQTVVKQDITETLLNNRNSLKQKGSLRRSPDSIDIHLPRSLSKSRVSSFNGPSVIIIIISLTL